MFRFVFNCQTLTRILSKRLMRVRWWWPLMLLSNVGDPDHAGLLDSVT